MKQKILLAFLSVALLSSAGAQKKSQKETAYAITGSEKGNRNWMEVSLIDVATGEIINPVYRSKSEVQRLNARTGKPISITTPEQASQTYTIENRNGQGTNVYNIVSEQVNVIRVENAAQQRVATANENVKFAERRIMVRRQVIKKEEPFASKSAALAFDKKHNRLYYTPMGINQLRYIDLKAKTPSVYYFEDEAFGTVAGPADVDNQITRMVIAGDGNGYALTNSTNQLIQFTTGKKPTITNLGALTDDASNGKFSVKNKHAYGGDIVADDAGNIYLITANKRIYKIPLETKVAAYLGSIKGLPDGFTTNGAAVVKDNYIMVSSSNSTEGYYKFSLEDLLAEKFSEGAVYNASDLANANLLSTKKKKEEKQEELRQQDLAKENALSKNIFDKPGLQHALSVYPNPITNAITRVSVENYPAGRYEVHLVDLSGKLISKQQLQVNGKVQNMEFRFPVQMAKGTYMLRVISEAGKAMNSEKVLVQ
jgi:hypothetical protein